MIYLKTVDSPVGALTLSSDGRNLTGLWLAGQKYFEATIDSDEHKERDADLPVFGKTETWLEEYFKGNAPKMDLPLAPVGTEFRQRVWSHLLAIPYGSLSTYGAISQAITRETGKRTSARAVGGAVGHNPISIIIPCHRVVGSDGSLTGYAGGTDRKLALLKLEGALR